MKVKGATLWAVGLAIFLALPIASRAASTERTPLTQEIAQQLRDAKRSSWELRKMTDTLDAITRNGGSSWQSHSSYLNTVRDNVNQLGKMLASVEELKQHGTKSQQIAIQAMRPRLMETADALRTAIQLLNDNRYHVYFTGYGEAVRTVSEQSASLHETLDAVLAYEAARERLDQLESAPAASDRG